MALFGPPDIKKLEVRKNVKGLIKALGYQKDAQIRAAAASALGRIGDAEAVEGLVVALAETTDSIAIEAAEALGRIGDPRAVAPLVVKLRDGRSSVGRAAIRALARLQPASIGALIESITDTPGVRREAAAESLVRIGEPAVEALAALTDHNDQGVRECAARTLGQIGGARAVDALIGALRDEEEGVRLRATEALGGVGDPRAVDALIGAFRDEREGVRTRAREVLVQIGKPAVEPLIALLATEDLRLQTVDVLGQIGDPRAAADLSGYLGDKNVRVRERAAEALAGMNWKPSQDETAAWYRIARRNWNAVVKLGPAAVAPLIAVLGDDADIIRARAARALGDIGDSRALEPLVSVLKDKEPFVRRAAAEMLDGMGWTPPTVEMEAWRAVAMEDWTAAEQLGEGAFAPLSMTADQNNAQAAEAAATLARMGNREPLDRLVSRCLLALNARGADEHQVLAAKALVVAYKHGELDDEQKARILNQRKRFKREHSDETYHADVGCWSDRQSGREHTDRFLGVDFPL